MAPDLDICGSLLLVIQICQHDSTLQAVIAQPHPVRLVPDLDICGILSELVESANPTVL